VTPAGATPGGALRGRDPSGKLARVESTGAATAQRRGSSAGQRGQYGIDGGTIAVPVFALAEAGLAGTAAWAIGHRRRGIAGLAGLAGLAVAGSAASYLYSTTSTTPPGAAIQNIAGTEGRRQALHEAVRMLRGGGRLRIVDDRADRYADILRDAGCVDITVRRLGWQTWYGMPGHHLRVAAASKPSG
jgi:hypothetical protein